MSGKGSKSRITNRIAFRENFDKINWSSTKKTCKNNCKCDNSNSCDCNGSCNGNCKCNCKNKIKEG